MSAALPMIITLRPSRRLAVGLVLAHLAAAGAVAAIGLPLWLTLSIASALFVHGTWVTARAALRRGRDAIVAVVAGRGETLSFQTRDGAWHEGRMLGTSCVAPCLTVLNIRARGERQARHVVILPDAIDPGDFRRLRVWLRWGVQQEGAVQGR